MSDKRVLLMMLPFWPTIIPPLGIASLKNHLKQYSFNVETIDANIESEFSNLLHTYLSVLKSILPKENVVNFYAIANNVVEKHLVIHQHLYHKNRILYNNLVKLIIEKYFLCKVTDTNDLIEPLERFYEYLDKYLENTILKSKPSIIGLSVYTSNYAASVFAFRKIKKAFPEIKTIMGGGIFVGDMAMGSPNFNYFVENEDSIDKIFVGEGESLLYAYLTGNLDDNKRIYTNDDVAGDGINLENLAVPDFTDFQLDKYVALSIASSRGCPFQCSFCSEANYLGKYRKSKAESIVSAMNEMKQKYQKNLFVLCDSLLNPIINDLAKIIHSHNDSFYWDGYLRIDNKSASIDQTFEWRRSGMYRARIGVESGSDMVLKMMNKKISKQQIKKSLENLALVGIKTTTYWVVGHPGESDENFKETLDLIEEYKDYIYEVQFNNFYFYKQGQVNSSNWERESLVVPLFPEKYLKYLGIQNWHLDSYPEREIVFERMKSLDEHCKKLGIPIISSLRDINKADNRWTQLHKNSVPPLADFFQINNKDITIDEHKHVKKPCLTHETIKIDNDWKF